MLVRISISPVAPVGLIIFIQVEFPFVGKAYGAP